MPEQCKLVVSGLSRLDDGLDLLSIFVWSPLGHCCAFTGTHNPLLTSYVTTLFIVQGT